MLDWGAGKGLLTQRVLQLRLFKSVTAIDIQSRPESLDPSVIWMQADLNEPVNIENETFDLILSAEVIEHLENPRALVREWLRLLKPGGLLIFSTPNNESWRSILALIFRGHFVSFGDSSYPAHITALVRKDISRILCEAGFIDTQLLFTNFGVIPKLPKYYWQDVPLTSFRGLRFSDNLLAVARKPKM
ncbi:methyltransferase domain-containing protein [Phormidium sp. FACHB-322]|nr:methyltransferase domain-containing protein [Phormidium sp. FACHB-322]MBD2049984.1 methyltransferase domain-containing protein [Leptolyngbya sp. FACHB-60]